MNSKPQIPAKPTAEPNTTTSGSIFIDNSPTGNQAAILDRPNTSISEVPVPSARGPGYSWPCLLPANSD